MLTIFGLSILLPDSLLFLATPVGAFIATALVWALIAGLVHLLFTRILKALTRRMPGEIEDIIVEILRKPLFYLVVTYGIVNSLKLLPLPPAIILFLSRATSTVLTLVILQLIWRVLKDIVLYYGGIWARKTESRLDDILIPILNLIGPLAIIITATLIILPIWGVDITSVLVGAGLVGLILGLALQDTLSNIFSGMSLMVESPFRTGDLIELNNGTICEVEKLGLRSTQLYALDTHSTIYMPNKVLVTEKIVNITKPTVEQKANINLKINAAASLPRVQAALERIAAGHPCVLTTELPTKIELIREQVAHNRREAAAWPEGDPASQRLLDEAQRYEQSIHKLKLEDVFDRQLQMLENSLANLSTAISQRETHGFTQAEMRELREGFISRVDDDLRKLVARSEAWSRTPDPWATFSENDSQHRVWQTRNENLVNKWNSLKRSLERPWERQESRLDDLVQQLHDWLPVEYKVPTEAWKNPEVIYVDFDGSAMHLKLWFYVDNIRLEHHDRSQRVITEIARRVREYLRTENIWAD